MGKANTPDVENIGDIDRFCAGSWFAAGNACLYVHGTDQMNNRVMVQWEKGQGKKDGQQMMPFGEFLDTVVLGVPSSTFVVVDGTLQYVWVNAQQRTTQGYRMSHSRWDGFPTIPKLADPVVVRQVFFPEYASFKGALALLEAGKVIGAALAPNLGLISMETGPVRLVYQTTLIGHVEKGRPVVLPKYKHLSIIVESICNPS